MSASEIVIWALLWAAGGFVGGWLARAYHCWAKHAPLPGICGDQAERIFVYDTAQPLCELRAGHAGWHESADGDTRWAHRREEPG